MFLVERMISLLTYAFVLFLACQLIGKATKKEYKIVLNVYLIDLCIFAFIYKPYITADLYRLRQYIQSWIYEDWNGVFRYAMEYTNTPAWVMYSYILSKLGNINWLQTITCFWCFKNVLYIISHEIERLNIKYYNRSIMLFYIMAVGSFFLQTISGIRSMLGFSIVAFCFYRETIEEKNILADIPRYLFAGLLHNAVMVLVVFRVIFYYVQVKGHINRFFTGLSIIGLMLIAVVQFDDYFYEIVNYSISYLTNSDQYIYYWEILVGLLETIENIYVLRFFQNCIVPLYNTTGRGVELAGYKLTWLFVSLMTIVTILALPFSYSVFRRYTIFSTIITLPLVGKNLQQIDKKSEYMTFRIKILFLSVLIFIISAIRGDLCGYKFFILA